MNLEEVTLRKERLLDGIVFHVDRHDVRLGDGTESKRDIVEHIGGVGVLARTPSGKILLVRQYRKAVESEVLEIVAGMREPGEEPEVSALRELEEETGYKATRIWSLGYFYASPGYTTEAIYLFAAETEATPGATKLDADELLQLVEVDEADLAAMIQQGELHDGKTLLAWLLSRDRLGKEASTWQ